MPRNVVSGEFTKVVQRIPVRIQIEKDDRWPQLRAGLSVRATIEHGPGDPEWADRAARELAEIETRFNRVTTNDFVANDVGASPSPEQRVDRPSEQSPWSAAIPIVPILLTVYQTLVLTDVTSDVIRKGIEGDKYSMIWTNVCWGVATLYGVFAGLWAMPRFGARIMLQIGLAWFAVGNLLCGAAVDISTLSAAKLVEGIGKGLVIILCRSTLYKQFDRMVIVADRLLWRRRLRDASDDAAGDGPH